MSDQHIDIVDDLEFTEGDMTLISSDNVRFRVESYHVFHASPVLRAPAEHSVRGQAKQIEFTDTEFETAEVLRLFLKALVAMSFKAFSSDDPPSILRQIRLIKFLQKYECHTIRVALATHLKACAQEDAAAAFVLAAHLDDKALCGSLLTLSFPEQGGHWDMHFQLWMLLPPEYAFAAAATWRLASSNRGIKAGYGYEQPSDRFYKTLEEANTA